MASEPTFTPIPGFAFPPSDVLAQIAARNAQPRRFDQVPDGCWVACIAGLTDIPHDALAALVPQHVTDAYKSPEYHNGVNRLMRSSGWRLAYIGPDVPRGFAIGSGTSPRGLHHAVIVLDGKLWHDPHPSRAGLAEIEEFECVIPLVDSPAMRTAHDCIASGCQDDDGDAHYVEPHGPAPTTETPDNG